MLIKLFLIGQTLGQFSDKDWKDQPGSRSSQQAYPVYLSFRFLLSVFPLLPAHWFYKHAYVCLFSLIFLKESKSNKFRKLSRKTKFCWRIHISWTQDVVHFQIQWSFKVLEAKFLENPMCLLWRHQSSNLQLWSRSWLIPQDSPFCQCAQGWVL